MKKRLLSMAAATAFLIVATPAPQAQAVAAKLPMLDAAESSSIVEVRRRGHRSFKRFHRRSFHGGFHRRHRFVRRHRGPRFGIWLGPSLRIHYGRRSCAWLRRRAIITGSSYWWRRYRWCRGW
ncbi:MAG: hypothetical protein KJZ80_00955 [Hyphomicrobiaceae bacterium]|nr:hypothetical protein [Hyphomicrobiaceae bacterium]